jgi:hypothetical protein
MWFEEHLASFALAPTYWHRQIENDAEPIGQCKALLIRLALQFILKCPIAHHGGALLPFV